uniref:Uncharacterized protein n=1 Tax=Sphaerodactylus townsendi TaxID=933632 RepID=A0ACB8F609_9SAUR
MGPAPDAEKAWQESPAPLARVGATSGQEEVTRTSSTLLLRLRFQAHSLIKLSPPTQLPQGWEQEDLQLANGSVLGRTNGSVLGPFPTLVVPLYAALQLNSLACPSGRHDPV